MHRCPSVLCAVGLALSACVRVSTAPIEVKPIHVTVDVNVKVDQALADVFGDLDKKDPSMAQGSN